MKHFIRSDQGTVSLYLIIIITAIFMFNAVLIDYARIRIAEKQSEHAVKAALRSTLSAYDRELRQYGLFGIGIDVEQQNALMKLVMQENISNESDNLHFNYIDLQLETDALHMIPMYSLAHHSIFEQQILETMKYVAPLEFTQHLVGKFSKVTSTVQSAQQYASDMTQLEALLKRRERKLDAAWDIVTEIIELVGKNYRNQAEHYQPSHDFSMISILKQQVDLLLDDASSLDREIEQALQSTYNKEGPGEVFHYVEVLGSDYFIRYQNELTEIVALFGGYNEQLKVYSNESSVETNVDEMNSAYAEQTQQWYNGKRGEIEERRSKYSHLKQMQELEKRNTEEQINQAKKSLSENSCQEEDQKHYANLNGDQGLFRSYLSFNNADTDPDNEVMIDPTLQLENKLEDIGNEAVSIASSLVERLKVLTDELYMNEFALINFNYRTDSSSSSLSHPLQNQEAEYILYGLQSCSSNLAAAYAEIYMIRLGIHLAEALTDPKKVATGSPILVFLVALAEGATKAVADMDKLLRGEDVALTTKLHSVKLNYKDYLRIFLFLHSNDKKKLSRMQALIQMNTRVDLTHKQTHLLASAETTLRLWFIPGVIRALSVVSLLDGAIEGNRYKILKHATMSY